jgi:DNA-binding CsgD family transcriptional regulator
MGSALHTGDWPLVGRGDALLDIGTALGAGGVVLSGALGVGRTRLAREAASRARAAGYTVEWVAATRAAASVPFGAVSHLITAAERERHDPLELLLRAAETLSARATDGPLIVAVDDAHLLDDGSAALIYQLAVRGTALVVATVREGAPGPDAITALWKDGPAALVPVSPLGEPAMERLMVHTLGAPVEAASRAELQRIAAGSPLVLRLLLDDALRDHSLVRLVHAWTWMRERYLGDGLADWVDDLLAGLPDPVRMVVEVISCGEPLPVAALDRLVDMEALEAEAVYAAERSGVIVRERSGPEPSLRPGHPSYGEAIRARLPLVRARRVREWLVRAGTGAWAPADVMPALTAREREIALMVASGLSSKIIAERLKLSVRTVNNHLAHVYTKLGVTSRSQLAALVFPAGSPPLSG